MIRRVSSVLTLALVVLGLVACGDNLKPFQPDSGTPDTPLSSAKELTSFKFEAAHNSALSNDVTATISGTTINATVPFGVDRTALVATFETTGATVSVGGTVQASGTTANDFTGVVTYTVTAANGSKSDYLVTITSAPSNAKALTTFSFTDATNTALDADVVATITGTTITATVPFNTNVTALVATFSTTGTSVKVGATAQVSGTTANNFTSAVQYVVTAADNSTQTYTVTVTVAANDAKAITAFGFAAADNPGVLTVNANGVITGQSIAVTVPFGTTITGLKANFTTTGDSVMVGTTTQVSGTTANNFTTAVVYIVTAANASTQTYTVTVSIAPNDAKDITSFQFLTVNNPVLPANVTATISGNVITAIVPNGTNITSLKATFVTTGDIVKVGTVVQTSSVTINDFTTAVTYTVVAANASMQNYTVTVVNSNASSKDITAFSINGVDGIISGQTISVVLPNGTNVTALVPTIAINGTSVSPGSLVPHDFTTPATYVVTAADTTTKSYTVTVTLANLSAKDITRFTINGLDAVIANTSATAGTITINMPNGTNLASLTPVVTITGKSVAPASLQTVDFSNNVNYVVTAADGSTKTYVVSVGVVNGNGTKLITSFTILGVSGQISNGASNSTITLTLPAGTDLTAQTPTIVINGASLSPPSRVPENFTQPFQYTVTATDGSTRVYTVTITLAP